jgi:VCBS repeat-containing protein
LVVDVIPVSGPSNGLVVLNADGTFTYTPNPGYIGPDSFVYRITDGRGGQSQATVNITVDPIQIAPIAVDDAFIMLEDGSMVIDALSGMLANDSDPNSDPIVVNTTAVTGPANGTLTMNADGSFTYTPNANFNGSDSFTYELQDDQGGTDQATVDITITPVNDAPTGGADNFNVANTSGLAFTDNALLANDSDIENDPLTIVAHTNPSFGFLTDDGSGNYFYTPMTDFVGNDTFSYTVEDSNGAQSTVFIVINVTDDGVVTPPPPEPTDPDPITPVPPTEIDENTGGGIDPFVPPPSGGSSGVQTGTPTVEEWTNTETVPITELETPEITEVVAEERTIEPAAMPLVSINKLSGVELQGYGMEKVNNEALLLALDQMGKDMGAMGANNGVLIGTITTGSGFMLTAGIISWVLRGGALASAMVASMPMIKMMDPLPFVAARRRKKEKEEEEEEERALTDTQRIEKVKKDQWAQDIGAEKFFNGDMNPQGQCES